MWLCNVAGLMHNYQFCFGRMGSCRPTRPARYARAGARCEVPGALRLANGLAAEEAQPNSSVNFIPVNKFPIAAVMGSEICLGRSLNASRRHDLQPGLTKQIRLPNRWLAVTSSLSVLTYPR